MNPLDQTRNNVIVAVPKWRYERLTAVENLVEIMLSRYDLLESLMGSEDESSAKEMFVLAIQALKDAGVQPFGEIRPKTL